MLLLLRFIVYIKRRSIVNRIRVQKKNKVVLLFFMILFLGISYLSKEMQFNHNMYLEYSQVICSVNIITFLGVMGCMMMCLKSLLNWNKINLRGAYESLAMYLPKKLESLYFCCLLDRYVNFCIVIAFAGFLFFRSVDYILFLMLLGFLFTIEEFVYGLVTYVNISNFMRIVLLLINFVCALISCFFNEYVRGVLLISIFAVDFLFFYIFGFRFQKYYASIQKTKKTNGKRAFLFLFHLFRRIIKDASLAFVISKELIQIYMEKIPLIYSLIYGLLFTMIVPFVYKINQNDVIITFCFFTSIAYTLVAVSINCFARDVKKVWIYQLYKVSHSVIILGKYVAYCIYAYGVVAIYTIIYTFLTMNNNYTFIFSKNRILEVLLLIVPITFFFGAIAGSFLAPRIKYKNNNVDYNYNGLEIIILLATSYFISLPICFLDQLFSKIIMWRLIVLGSILIHAVLIKLLKKRMHIFLTNA